MEYPPENLLGGDLFWWREDGVFHTLVTISGAIEMNNALPRHSLPQATLTFALFDPEGNFQFDWRREVKPEETIFIDSALIRQEQGREQMIQEGVLAVFVSAKTEPSEEMKQRYSRLYSLVDWHSDDGDLVSLHNDQSIVMQRDGTEPTAFTEIVLLETTEDVNYLVIINGPETQRFGGLCLEVKNHRGQILRAVYAPEMRPYSLHKIYLARLFPGLAKFCEGRHATLSGQFDCRGIFTRPYVMTQGRRLSGYHGGDLYHWTNSPRPYYNCFGRGEVNPMVVVQRDGLSTTVNLLNTHGHLEEDFWVDARLYDEAGGLVVERERWLLARRHQLSRGEVSELLPEPDQSFTGHIALNFSSEFRAQYPGRLQALLEYRTSQGAARVMAWSDIWNARDRWNAFLDQMAVFKGFADNLGNRYPLEAHLINRCFYRVWVQPPIISYISVTNCGVTPGYDRTVGYRLRLENGRGGALIYEGELQPQGTDFAPVDQFFPQLTDVLGEQPVAMAVIESEADLAVMHLSYHQKSGVYSAEHFMASTSYHEGKYYSPCGA